MIEKNLLTFTFFIWMLSLVSGLSLEEVTNRPCTPWHFRCDNNRCTLKHYRCDNDRDCSDGSDERNCHLSLFDLPRFERFEKVRMKAAKWLIKQVEMEPKLRSWGYSPVRVSIALYIHNETYFYHGNRTGNVISSELQIELLSKLAHQNADEMDLAELASFINALIAVCLDPREFYGVDLVAKLRSRVDAVDEVSPAPFIALCNAGDLLTSDDVRKLITVFDSGSRALWTDMQAMALMGLICAARQKENITSTLYRYSAKLKLPINSTTGILDNIKTTGLVLQALIAAGDTFDTTMKMSDIFWKLSEGQNADGSFGDVWNTYYILPIFSWKSLINITSAHCTEDSRRERKIYKEWLGEKKKIKYSLWLGTSKYMTSTLTLNVPVEETFFSIMKVATQINEKYSFETSMRNGKPYVYSISEVEDDPETGNLWYLFRVRNETTTERINISPIDYMPENDVHLVYWFREVPSYT